MTKNILITGGASGIGAETCLLAAERGYAVAINYRSRGAEANRLVDRIAEKGGKAVAIAADVANEDEVEAMFETVAATFGSIDALVNNAAYNMGGVMVADMTAEGMARMLTVNVLGTVLCCREAVRRMATGRGGAGGVIVNVSSQAGTFGGRPGRAGYAATKGAVDSFTLGLAREVGDQGIRVNALRPGMTMTPMTEAAWRDPDRRAGIEATIPMGRLAEPIEMARPILWLLSDEASFVSGALLNVTGGGLHFG